MKRCLVIGGGIGGVLSARVLERCGREVALLEASNRLGGCAGTFERNGLLYNIGATTVPALLPGYPLKTLLDLINNSALEVADVKLIDPAIIITNGKYWVRRFMELEASIEEWNIAFPGLKGHKKLLELSYKITQNLLQHTVYFNWNGLPEKAKTLLRNLPQILKVGPLFFKPALTLLKEIYGDNIPEEFYFFLDAQVRITLQASLNEVSALALLLAIGYPFTGIGKVTDGMGRLIEALALPLEYLLETKVEKIKRVRDGFKVFAEVEGEFFSEELLLAFPFLENLQVFEDDEIRAYFSKFKELLSPYSALVVYGEYTGRNLHLSPSYLVILPKNKKSPYSSGYLFLSFLPLKKGKVTFTLSTHTPLIMWNGNLENVSLIKEALLKTLLENLCEVLSEDISHFADSFIATPFTFQRYLHKIHTGGIPYTLKNNPFHIPGNVTPFKGLYLSGEHCFSYQGWLGISVGVLNLYYQLKQGL